MLNNTLTACAMWQPLFVQAMMLHLCLPTRHVVPIWPRTNQLGHVPKDTSGSIAAPEPAQRQKPAEGKAFARGQKPATAVLTPEIMLFSLHLNLLYLDSRGSWICCV